MTSPLPRRLAVLSDPHGNLEALTSVLADMDQQGADAAVCLGDAIGYGPEPEAVVELLRARRMPMILGNHEHGIADHAQLCRFNPQARAALERTACLLRPDTVTFLANLPHFLTLFGARFVHGCPPDRVNTYLFGIKDQALAALTRHLGSREKAEGGGETPAGITVVTCVPPPDPPPEERLRQGPPSPTGEGGAAGNA